MYCSQYYTRKRKTHSSKRRSRTRSHARNAKRCASSSQDGAQGRGDDRAHPTTRNCNDAHLLRRHVQLHNQMLDAPWRQGWKRRFAGSYDRKEQSQRLPRREVAEGQQLFHDRPRRENLLNPALTTVRVVGINWAPFYNLLMLRLMSTSGCTA